LALATATIAGPADAQSRVTRMVVGFPAGGPVDIVARHIAEPMAKELGHPVIIDNKPGGNTQIAGQFVATSSGDGSVIFLSSMSTVVLNPLLYEKLPYNVDTDFVPVSAVVSSPTVLVAHPSNGATDAASFAAASKSAADPVPIGSAGVGGTTHISLELFAQVTGAKLLHVPYKGAAPVINDLLGNQVSGFFGDLPGVISHIRSGRLKAVALLAPAPHPLLPGIKTTKDSGFEGLEAENWYGIYAPPKTSPELVARLNKAVHAALSDAGVKAKLEDTGAVLIPSTPAELRERQQADTARMGAIIKARNIKLE